MNNESSNHELHLLHKESFPKTTDIPYPLPSPPTHILLPLFSLCTSMDWDKDGDMLAVTQDRNGMSYVCTPGYSSRLHYHARLHIKFPVFHYANACICPCSLLLFVHRLNVTCIHVCVQTSVRLLNFARNVTICMCLCMLRLRWEYLDIWYRYVVPVECTHVWGDQDGHWNEVSCAVWIALIAILKVDSKA